MWPVTSRPRRMVAPLAAAQKTTVPLVAPEAPEVIASHGTFVVAVHDTFAVT